jgi:hypothetical protein
MRHVCRQKGVVVTHLPAEGGLDKWFRHRCAWCDEWKILLVEIMPGIEAAQTDRRLKCQR